MAPLPDERAGSACLTAPETEAGPDALRDAPLHITGRMVDSSNNAMLADVDTGTATVPCVYKPIRGERPLWDFPDGSLAAREVAAYEVSQLAGWDCVPLTLLRDGPFGPGMVQQWITEAQPELAANLVPVGEVPAGWLPVLRAALEDGTDVVLAHSTADALAVLAGFDLAVNNADRKASHILATTDGRIRGVDHGLAFHEEPKLRTILWGFAGRPLPDRVITGCRRIVDALAGPWADRLEELITGREVAAFAARVERLLADPVFPAPPADRTPIPWPPL